MNFVDSLVPMGDDVDIITYTELFYGAGYQHQHYACTNDEGQEI